MIKMDRKDLRVGPSMSKERLKAGLGQDLIERSLLLLSPDQISRLLSGETLEWRRKRAFR